MPTLAIRAASRRNAARKVNHLDLLLTPAQFSDSVLYGHESPKMPERLITPTVKDRGGIICLNPPEGGFFYCGRIEAGRGSDHLHASSARSPARPA